MLKNIYFKKQKQKDFLKLQWFSLSIAQKNYIQG